MLVIDNSIDTFLTTPAEFGELHAQIDRDLDGEGFDRNTPTVIRIRVGSYHAQQGNRSRLFLL